MLSQLRSRPLNLLKRQRKRLLHSSRTSWAEREKFNPANVERAEDEVDVCIVGAGPAGLSAAIRLKQLEQEKGREIRVVVLEKGSEVGEQEAVSLVRHKISLIFLLEVLISCLAPLLSLELSTSFSPTGKRERGIL